MHKFRLAEKYYSKQDEKALSAYDFFRTFVHPLIHYTQLPKARKPTAPMSTEATASIVFGILQLSIGLIALWQQYRLSQMHRLSSLS